MGKTIAIETFALEQLDDCKKRALHKKASFIKWAPTMSTLTNQEVNLRFVTEGDFTIKCVKYICSCKLLTLQGQSEMDKTHHIAYAQINSKF